jgi:hypothetical protein
MSPTVHELRNEIRARTGRFERETNATFTKEELLALANSVGYAVEPGRMPSTATMRAGIRWQTGLLAERDRRVGTDPFEMADVGDLDSGTFRKAELEALVTLLETMPDAESPTVE